MNREVANELLKEYRSLAISQASPMTPQQAEEIAQRLAHTESILVHALTNSKEKAA